jgi:Flagellar P-ring protein
MYCPGWEIVSVLDKNVALGGLPRAVSLCFFNDVEARMRVFTHRMTAYLGAIVLSICGCSSMMDRRSESQVKRAKIKKQLEAENRPTMLKQIATPRQLGMAGIKNIALVTHLPNTGGAVNPSAQRERLIESLRRNEVPDPNQLLDDKKTAMVLANAWVPPAARAGQRYNVGVELSTHSQASDLRQGWLRMTPLVEMNLFEGEGRVRTSFDYAKAEGSIVTVAQFSGADDPDSKVKGFVVGGAKLLKNRDLGVGIDPEYADAITMHSVIPAINARFTYFDGTGEKGSAVPLNDEYIELHLPSLYANDPYHFVNVALRITFNEPAEQRNERVKRLTSEIANAATAREAAWELEALGKSSIEILASQLGNPDQEVRFYCAHSLAYLGDARAAEVLKGLAVDQAAFRAMSLTALASMEHYVAEEALRELLNSAEPEARYGAVRTLRKRNEKEPLVTANQVTQVGGLLEIPSSGPELVAVSLIDTPEVVFFGQVPAITIPQVHNVNSQIRVQQTNPNEIMVTRFMPDSDEKVGVRCRPDLGSVLKAIGQVGGGYGDWVSFVRECHSLGYMKTPLAMNPVPATGQIFDRETGTSVAASKDLDDTSSDTEELSLEESIWYKPWTWGS